MIGPFNLQQIEEILYKNSNIKNIKEIIPIDEGISSYTYKVESLDKNYYFSTLINSYKEYPLSPRMILLSKISKQGVKVPTPLTYKDFDDDLENYSWALVTEVAGTDLEKDTSNTKKVLMEAGKDLAKLHKIPCEGFGYVRSVKGEEPRGESESYYEHLTFRLRNPAPFEEKLNLLLDNKILSATQLEQVISFIEKNMHWITPKEGVLMHGDFSKEHIFHEDGIYTGIIDWDGISVGTGLYDLVQFETLNTEKEFSALLEGYLEVSETKYNDEFKQRLLVERLLYVIPKVARVIQAKRSNARYTSPERENKLMNHLEKMLKVVSG